MEHVRCVILVGISQDRPDAPDGEVTGLVDDDPVAPEDDPDRRDRVARLVGVLDRAARARARPVRHTRAHPGELALVDVTDQLAVRRPAVAGDEILRVSRDVEHQAATFDALFDLHRLAADQPEAVELVLAGGLLHHAADPEIHVHLISRPVTVERDGARGDMVVTLVGDAVAMADEELLGGTGLVDAGAAAGAGHDVVATLTSPLDPVLTDVLAGWARRCLRVPHEVGDDWIAPSGPTTRLVPAPALVARRRGAAALRTAYDRITAELADPARPLPVGLAQLVEAIEPADRAAWLARAGHDAAPPDDPLFPLPVGAAQARILTRLGRDSGVVVEGPPGTGKTHTIANLLCALLADGRRVLVTSEKAQALRVLRDKLPPEMRDLCVSLADPGSDPRTDPPTDPEADAAASIAGLAARSTEFDPDEADREIAELTERRRALLAERAAELDALAAARGAETVDHGGVAPGFAGTRADVARRVVATRAEDGWLAELVGPDPDLPADPPLGGAELDELGSLLASGTPQRRARTDQYLPPPVELPPESHVAELAALVGRGEAAVAGDGGRLVAALGHLPAEQARRLPVPCRRVADALAALDETGADREWARGVVDAVLAGRAAPLWGRAVEQLARVDELTEHDRAAGPAQVQVAESVDPAAAAPAVERFAEHLADGGGVKRLFKPDAQRAAEPHLRDVTVRGADPSTASGAAAVAHHLRILEITDHLAEGFGPLGYTVRRAEHRALLVEQALTLRATCLRVGAVLTAAATLRSLLTALPAARRPRLDGLTALEAVPSVILGVAETREGALARAELADVVERLEGGVPEHRWAPELAPVVGALRHRDADGYAEAVAALEAALTELRDQRRADELAARLDAVVPGLSGHLDGLGPDRVARWAPAWAHARAVGWLAGGAGVPGVDERLDDLEVELGDVTARLAAARAWRACLGRVGAEQMRALQSHRTATAAVGRGAGRWADRFRRAAREAVEVARGAVPAWVMPIREVLATVEPVRDAFDVVIVDEASQADLTSLFLLWLAPRVIVVGDDRQCTPPEVGLGSLEPAFARVDTDLADVPFWLRSQFTPRSSVFSVFRTTFGPPIRLREHFRSMPEIVAWSSREFYAAEPLVPLRQFGAERLPPLRATFVPGARVRGDGGALTNPAEAGALVDAVVRAAKDPAYDDATFGVVVLQGHGQVELLERMLRERLDAEVWTARRLRVGAPADFQGDERTVVWLSMVVAPGHRFVALTADRYRQGFNVAASRARDQLWLFHSVAVDDLGAADLRRHLLEHVTADEPAGFLGVPPSGVTDDRRHPAFDSRFAQRVFLDLAARGYTVVPGVALHGRRLDLVVTGPAARLAVVCDGPERRRPVDRDEVAAEHDLRRCGWPVVRVAEADHVLDADAALAPLLAALDAAGITPTDARAPVTVVERAPGDGREYVPGGLGGPTDTVDALVEDLVADGFAPPRRDAEVRDPRDGSLLVVAAALWPTGISLRALAAPVVLTPDADPYAASRLRGLGYVVFTEPAEVRERVAGA